MLKIHKGLKKKKKDKKNKRKEDELFNEEELEKYRKEHSNVVPSSDAHLAQPLNSSEQSDEWQKFKALTAGVDTILQKTQEDLDRIKSTSFFQRKAPPSELEKQKEEEHTADNQQTVKENHEDGEQRSDQHQSDRAVRFQDKSESEEESEEVEVDDTLFDTSYVDAVASGELKLAYIPDSPPDKEDDFDPFDTSYANKFIESNPKKRYLNLGCAVQVLSGRETSSASSAVFLEKKSPRRRPKPVDLLLTSFDEGVDAKSAPVAATVTERTPVDSPVKTLLDEDPLFVADENLVIAPLAITPIPPAPPASTPINSAADADNQKQPKLDLSDFELNEFDVVTTASSATVDILNLQKQPSNESTDDEFAQLAADSLARKSSSAQPTPNDPSTLQGTVIKSSLDTVSPTAESIAVNPLQPVAPDQQEEIDPFDTSIVAQVILPGKQEIKLLEQELLSDITQVGHIAPTLTDIDDDFDPRAGEPTHTKPVRPQELLIKQVALAEKIVSPSKKPDLLKIEEVDVEVAKPLTPLAVANQDPSVDEEYDPFDTSHICGAPGKLELKLIENELTKQVDGTFANQQDDDDFDPRKYEKIDCGQTVTASITCHILNKYSCNPDTLEQKVAEPIAIDILTGKEEEDALRNISTPVEPAKYVIESPDIAYSDPFDTSIADNIQPGKVELKLLETELITKH